MARTQVALVTGRVCRARLTPDVSRCYPGRVKPVGDLSGAAAATSGIRSGDRLYDRDGRRQRQYADDFADIYWRLHIRSGALIVGIDTDDADRAPSSGRCSILCGSRLCAASSGPTPPPVAGATQRHGASVTQQTVIRP